MPRFDAGPVCESFVMDKVVWGQVSLQVHQFSFVSIITPMLYTLLHLHATPTRKTNGQSLGNFNKQCSFRSQGVLDVKVLSLKKKHCLL
jgi:hypothetical protein